jgi:hypothetical protein
MSFTIKKKSKNIETPTQSHGISFAEARKRSLAHLYGETACKTPQTTATSK